VTHILLAIVVAGLGAAAVQVQGLPEGFAVLIAGMLFTKRILLFGIGAREFLLPPNNA